MTGRIVVVGFVWLLAATTVLVQRHSEGADAARHRNSAPTQSTREQDSERDADARKTNERRLTEGAAKVLNLVGELKKSLSLSSDAASGH